MSKMFVGKSKEQNLKVGGGYQEEPTGILCLGGRFRAIYENSKKAKKERAKQRRNLCLYGICVFTSNFAITLMERFVGTNFWVAYWGNLLYEVTNVTELYIGIKTLKLWQMLILHIITSSLGYVLAQYIGNMI